MGVMGMASAGVAVEDVATPALRGVTGVATSEAMSATW